MYRKLTSLLRDDHGAETVEWVILVAAAVLMFTAGFPLLGEKTDRLLEPLFERFNLQTLELEAAKRDVPGDSEGVADRPGFHPLRKNRFGKSIQRATNLDETD